MRTPPPGDDHNWYSAKKKKTMWFIGVEVEQETSAPPPKKILDPPLFTNACSKKIYVYINVTHPYELYFQEKFSFSSSRLSSSRIHVTNRKT